jgi:hypothetical protein
MPPREAFAKDYIPVADRIAEFYAKHPEGSLQSEILTLTDSLVLVKGWAYRTPDDPRPGIGHSSLGIPGNTPYTRGSEVENAETSAWGRAIAALGFEVKNGVATAEDVRNKSGSQPAVPRPVARDATPTHNAAPRASSAPTGGGIKVGQALEAIKAAGIDAKVVSAKGKELYGQWSLKEMTADQRAHVVEELTGGGRPAAPAATPTEDEPGLAWEGLDAA